jgi:phospholipase C
MPEIGPSLTATRAEHLRDGGINGDAFIMAIDAGTLPPVAFYKPQGNLNEHPAYADVLLGDRHILELVNHLEKSPQWDHMLVVITYDENGGFRDHVAPPKGDRWGPGSRVPAIIVSPFAKRGYVDHTSATDTGFIEYPERSCCKPATGPGTTSWLAAFDVPDAWTRRSHGLRQSTSRRSKGR